MLDQNLSEKEIEKIKKERESHYKKHLPFLRLEAEYEELNAKISRSRTESLMFDRKFIEMLNEQKEAEKQFNEQSKKEK